MTSSIYHYTTTTPSRSFSHGHHLRTRTGADPSSTHPSRRIDSATTTTHVSTPRKHVRCVSPGTCATHSVPWTRPGGASGNVFPGGGQANGRPGASQSHSCHRRCRGAVSTARSPPHPATTPSHTSQPCMPTRQAPRQATTPAAQLGGGRDVPSHCHRWSHWRRRGGRRQWTGT